MANKNFDKIRCSFCNKTEDQVRKLIAGPGGVYICDECIDVCSEILEDELTDEELAEAGITQATIRLSIGTEHIDDIIADLEKGFAAV